MLTMDEETGATDANDSFSSTSMYNDTEMVATIAWHLSPFWMTCFALTLGCIIVVGILGNLLVIYVTSRCALLERGRLTTIDVYILHLSVADFLFLLFCVPFQGTVFLFNYWPYGLIVCKCAHYFQYFTMYASVWLLTLMSIDRYVAIGHPLRSVKMRSAHRANRSSQAVWMASAVLALPCLYLYTTDTMENGAVCFDDWTSATYPYRKWMILAVYMTSFFVPAFVILCMALLVCSAIRSSVHEPLLRSSSALAYGCQASKRLSATDSGASAVSASNCRRRRRRVVWLVFALALVYLLCNLPHSVHMVWLSSDDHAEELIEEYRWTLFAVKIASQMGTYVHSSVNPLLYSLASEQFRMRVLRAFCGNRKESAASCSAYYPSRRQSSPLRRRETLDFDRHI